MQQQTPPRRILVLGNAEKRGTAEYAESICSHLQDSGAEIVGIELSGADRIDPPAADVAIVLGGDGAILRAAMQLGEHQLPILGVNFGRLGFLAAINPEELCEACDQLMRGDFTLTEHVMLDVQLHRGGSPHPHFPGVRVLNELVISAGRPFRMIEVDLTVDRELVAKFQADGVILSTPIGSTAHSLSAGGPILSQTLPAVVITPICPHALTWRPLVESADRTFVLTCPNAAPGTTLVCDGHAQFPVTHDDEVIVRRSPAVFRLVRLRDYSPYTTLRAKLSWGSRQREG